MLRVVTTGEKLNGELGASGEAPKVALGDDAPEPACFLGVGGDRLIGFEVQVALDGEAELAADGLQFEEAHVAEFRLAQAEIAESEGQAVVRIELGQEPGTLRVGREEFDDGFEVDCVVAFVHRGALCSAVGEELFGERFGDECH